MAGGRLMQRVDALEGQRRDAFRGPAIWLVLEPGETEEQGIARYEAEHGPCKPGQPAVIWRTICTGVPRGEGALCA